MHHSKVLIVTSTVDKTVDYIVEQYSKEIEFFRINVDIFEEYTFSISDKGWKISSDLWSVSESEITSIYYRKPMLPDLSAFEEKYRFMIQKDIISLINGIVDSFSFTVLTKPSILRVVENKIYQLNYLRHRNIPIPRSYIGNSNKGWRNLSSKQLIIKPISTGKVKSKNGEEMYPTSIFDGIQENIKLTPVYIQEYIEKKFEVRITIVDKQIYAVRIDSLNRVDWRLDYTNHKYSNITCPRDIEENCLRMMRDFKLKFCTFDYIVTPENRWIFLELNPNGQWLWLELITGMDISKKIVDILC